MRCSWVNLKNQKYIEYHDKEWGIASYDDRYLFEMLILELFQSGLNWEIILNKRESFKKAYDNFDVYKISRYDNKKIIELMNNKNIIRNKLKIEASINNAKIFIDIKNEFQSFSNYIWSFTNYKVIHSKKNKTESALSKKISEDLKKRGMKFIGSKIIYSYLQAIGVIFDHELKCFKYQEEVCIKN